MASNNTNSEEPEGRLLAVIVVSGTLGETFYPATEDCPLALLPLVNNPLISYSLEWLKNNRVDDTIICCNGGDAERISSFCERWSDGNGNSMKLMVVGSDSDTPSLGEAIRDLNSKSLLKKDFILLDGFVVGNVNLRKALRKHKKFVKEDPDCVMTGVYLRRSIGIGPVKQRELDNVRRVRIDMDCTTSRILSHYRPVEPKKAFFPASKWFSSSSNVFSLPVEDPFLKICSVKVPMLYSSNRHYETIDCLIQNIIHQVETLKYNLRAYVPKGYAMQVSSLQTFQELSLIIVKRWLSPLVPEKCLLTQSTRYLIDEDHAIYYDESAIFEKNVLGRENVIGPKCQIDTECKINNTVLGKRCTIRGNVTINNSFLMDGVTIGNGCVVENCFLGENVRLFPGVDLHPGVVVGPNVILGPSIEVYQKRIVANPPEGHRVPVKKFYRGLCLNSFTCGKEGRGFEAKVDDGIDENEDIFDDGFFDFKWGEGRPIINNLPPLQEDTLRLTEMESFLTLDFSADEEKEREFGKKVMESLLLVTKRKAPAKSIVSELDSSWEICNISEENALRVYMKNILRVFEVSEGESNLMGRNLYQRVNKGLITFRDCIHSLVNNLKKEFILLNVLEEFVCEEERYVTVIHKIIQWLNQEFKIIEDDVLVYWYKKGGRGTRLFPSIARRIKEFVEQVEDATDEEDRLE